MTNTTVYTVLATTSYSGETSSYVVGVYTSREKAADAIKAEKSNLVGWRANEVSFDVTNLTVDRIY